MGNSCMQEPLSPRLTTTVNGVKLLLCIMLKQLVCVLLIAQSAAAWRRPFPKPRAARNHPQENDAWSAVREQLAGWPLTDNFAVQVGNASGTVFKFTKGNFSLHQRVETASTSKWPMAMGLLGLVADGTVPSLDAKVASYVDWWKPTNASDPTLARQQRPTMCSSLPS